MSGLEATAGVIVAGMSGPVESRTDHGAYIAAVAGRLQDRDVPVVGTRIGLNQGRRRSAVLQVHPESMAFPTPEEAFVGWDEENGWALALDVEPGTFEIVNPVYKGLAVLPDPDDVASWVVVLLTHPELTPSRDDHPFRDHSVEDPEFEAQLARYALGR